MTRIPASPLRPAVLAVLVSLLVGGAAGSRAQSPPDSLPPRGSLAGTVVAAATGLPVEGAIVQLEAAVEAGAGPPQGGDVAAAARVLVKNRDDLVIRVLPRYRHRGLRASRPIEALRSYLEKNGGVTSQQYAAPPVVRPHL
jgi:hypothetical protein